MTVAEREPQHGKEGKSPISLKGKIGRAMVGPFLMAGGIIGVNITDVSDYQIEQQVARLYPNALTPKELNGIRTGIVDAMHHNIQVARGRETAPPSTPTMFGRAIEVVVPQNLEGKIEFVQKAQEELNRAERMRGELKQEANQPIRQIGKYGALTLVFLGFLHILVFCLPSFKEIKVMISRPPKKTP